MKTESFSISASICFFIFISGCVAAPTKRWPIEITLTFRMSPKLVEDYKEMIRGLTDSEVAVEKAEDREDEDDFDIYDVADEYTEVIGENDDYFKDGPVSARIVGGQESAAHSKPHQISLQAFDSSDGSWRHYCGGSIIESNKILTAAHCVHDHNVKYLRVQAGEHDIFEMEADLSEQTRYIASAVVHPNYNDMTYDYDLAILHLSQPLDLDVKVNKIELAPADFVPAVGSNCVTTGWGSTHGDGSEWDEADKLQEVSLPIVDRLSCAQIYSGYNEVTARMLCAGWEDGQGAGICSGDSGGPLVCDSLLVGVTSWGSKPCGNYPGVFADVGAERNWIDAN